MTPVTRVAPMLLLAGAIACSDSTGTNDPPLAGDPATLTINMVAPAGVTPSAYLIGVGGFHRKVTATTTLTGGYWGEFSVLAEAAAGADPIVGVPYSAAVSGSPITLDAGDTGVVDVTYSQRASAGYLWVANISSNKVSGFTSAQLAASGTPVPAVSLSIKAARLAVDANGGIWVSHFSRDTLYYYTQAQLLAGGAPSPTIRIGTVGGSLDQPTGLAFDFQGDLWVANRGNNTLVEFTPSQLAATGSPAPIITITSVFNFMSTPWGIAFDSSGALWVASFGDSVVVGYSAAQLSFGGALTPFAGISNTAGAATQGVAFDAAGNLWVAGLGGKISKYTPSQLTALGAPVPSVVLSGSGLVAPGALAFDASGSLWVADVIGGHVLKYSAAQLAASGSPVPTVTLNNTGGSIAQPTDVVFSPHPPGLPMH